jgi:hypothetical protein
MSPPHTPFVPAKAGTQDHGRSICGPWIPAFAGTNGWGFSEQTDKRLA